MSLSIPPFTVTFTGTTRTEASSISRVEGPVQQHRHRVQHPDGWWLDIVLQEFDHGELDVSCLEYAPDTPLTLRGESRDFRMRSGEQRRVAEAQGGRDDEGSG